MIRPLIRSVLPILPSNPGFAVTRLMASLSSRPPLKDRDRKLLAEAARLEFGERSKKVAWSWGTGPVVVLVHGWGARAGQMTTLAKSIAEKNFRVIAFDVTAHGESKGRRTSFRDFILNVAELSAFLNTPIHAYVGHSAGGLGMMAARELKGVRAQKYVCLNAPRMPYVPINSIRRLLNPSDAILAKCKRYYAEQFSLTWETLDNCGAYLNPAQSELLLIYDVDDDVVEHTDAERIAAVWPNAKVVKTRGLGHNKIVWNEAVVKEVVSFI